MNEKTKLMIADFAESCYVFNEIAGKDQAVSMLDMKKQLMLIQEEVQEIADGLINNDVVEVLDGVIDALVVTIGMMQKLEALGVNVEEAMERTSANNLSKFTRDIQVANESVKMYSSRSENVKMEYNQKYDVFVLKDANDKVRKPWDFVSNDLSCCVPENLQQHGFGEFKE